MIKRIIFLMMFLLCPDEAFINRLIDSVDKQIDWPHDIHGYSYTLGKNVKYDKVEVSYQLSEKLNYRRDQKRLIELQKIYCEVINSNKQFSEHFTNIPLKPTDIHLGMVYIDYNRTIRWDITSISVYPNCIDYLSWTYIEGDATLPFKYGSETYEEALKVAYEEGPFERVVTHLQPGIENKTVELHGPWGFFIQRAVIEQINGGDFIYYAEVDGKKHKLCVEGDQVVLESSRKPIVEVFPLLDWIDFNEKCCEEARLKHLRKMEQEG